MRNGHENNGSRTAPNSLGVDRRTFLKTTAAGAGLATVAGCLGGGDDDGITLGALYITSGFASLYGEEGARGYELAVDEINDNGGIDGEEVTVISRDTESDANTAGRQMRSLIEEESVDGLFGLDSSGVAQALAPQVAQFQIPFMVTHAATPFLTSPEGEHEDSVGNDYVFRNANSLAQDIYGAARTAEELDATEWATIGPDYAFGYETWDYFQAFCEGLGVDAEFTAEQYPGLETGDYSPYISSIMDAEPDGVITPLWGADLTTFLGQAESAGWFDQIDYTLFSVGMGTDLPADGSPLPEGEYASTRYDPFVPDTDENNSFRDRYYDEYETLPTYNAEGAYRAVYLYKEAIESAGSADADDLVETFTGMEHSGPVGDYRFNEETNQATVPSIWGTVSYDDDWESNVLDPVEVYEATPDVVNDALGDSDLPSGV
ncbi:ABC transporter substrate-binding protein [Natronorubrum sulfidifaciens]|uniref:Extracellular ligand-binding receptor n=1 Tax=Natronorubrum sulfidifaciens JCM 14089 TaxID=1230460 RepID=L9W584_9EURY|nr:ABC transporter substrate-binding protein [Natronorubrum sulfidifaciens]ELY44456.1 extracellular ligand-binding receptor [Natronorubrum sulfidifaciens JCM 14089]